MPQDFSLNGLNAQEATLSDLLDWHFRKRALH
jgi:hypothetical protein